MKKFILYAGREIKKLARAGRLRYHRLFRRPRETDEKNTELSRPADFSNLPDPGPSKDEDHVRASGNFGGQEVGGDTKGARRPVWSLADFPVEELDEKSRFHDFPIPLEIMRAIAEADFRYCTPIQEKALADVLTGKDLVGKANTGTGKTAVFLIASFSRLLSKRWEQQQKGNVRALVLAPTRELVAQITKDARMLAKFCRLRIQEVFGGVDYEKQLVALQGKRCDLVVATPGRLLDFMGKGVVDLSCCRILVLDEADRMLDMGFIPDVRRIIGRLPGRGERQTMLFSATMPDDVRRLAMQWCVEPAFVEAEPEQVAVETVEQIVYLCTTEEKYTILYNLIERHQEDRILVFANMKNDAKRLADRLERNGVECVLLSGDVAQIKRMSRLERFRAGKVKVLVATDVAGRGIHIEGITFVVNYTLPYEPEDYVHRIGRTGRAGALGKAVSFACEEGSFYLPQIEEFIGRKLTCEVPEESLLSPPPAETIKQKTATGSSRNQKRRHPRRKANRTPRAKDG
jgi:ATP-dependent RNA helicase RhlB